MAKSINATQILRTKCGYTNGKLLCIPGNGSKSDDVISVVNLLTSNYMNDPSGEPLLVTSRFNAYADIEYNIIDTNSYFNNMFGDRLDDDQSSTHYNGVFNFLVRGELLKKPSNKVITEEDVAATAYNMGVFAFSNPGFISYTLGTYSGGGTSASTLIKRSASYYLFPPLSRGTVAANELKSMLTGSTPVEQLNNLFQKILNSTIESTATQFKYMNGITDPAEIQKANNSALNNAYPGSYLHNKLTTFIEKYGSLKPLVAPGLLKEINEIAYANALPGFETDKYNATAYVVLTDSSNVVIVDEISEINTLYTHPTVNNGTNIAVFNKSNFPKYIPADKSGKLYYTSESRYADYDKLLVIDPSLP